MVPKRRAAAPSSFAAPPKPRLSKFAKENNITNEQESEIRDAFGLFSEQGVKGYGKEKEGVIKAEDVRRCLVALGVKIRKPDLPDILETLDPTDTGYITYGPFLSLAALHLHHNDEEEDEGHSKEIQEAYNLFTDNRTGPITLVHLRRIAKLLKEDINDELLKDMLVEANGEGKEGWKRGVGVEEFESVMKRAGVF